MDQKSDFGRSVFDGKQDLLSPASKSIIFPHLIGSVCVILFYVLLSRPEVILVSKLGFTVWYPATGLILAVMLGLSPRYLPVAFVADVLAGWVGYHQPLLSWSATVGTLLGVACYAAAAYILRGPFRIDPRLSRRKDVARYVVATLVAAAGATVTGVACLAADHIITWHQYWASALAWYAGDGIALLSVAPFVLIHIIPGVQRMVGSPELMWPPGEEESTLQWAKLRVSAVVEALAQLSSIFAVLWIIFGHSAPTSHVYHFSFVPIIWVAMRQGIRRVVSAIVIFNFGVVIALRLFPAAGTDLPHLSLLMLVVSSTGLIVGSVVSERHRIARDLQERTIYLNSVIENGPLGIMVLDNKRRVEMCNEALERIYETGRNCLAGKELVSVISGSEEARETIELISQLEAGHKLHQTLKRIRKDGQTRYLDLHAVPLVVDGQSRGGLAIYEDISEKVKAEESAREHADALKRWVDELQLRTDQMTLLIDMGDRLQSCISSEESYQMIGHYLKQLFPVANAGALFIFKPSRNALNAEVTWGEPLVSELLFAPDDCWALRLGRPNWCEHPGGDVVSPHLKKQVEALCLCMPMMALGETLGILHLQYHHDRKSSGPGAFETLQVSQQRIASMVAGEIALSLANIHLRDTLRSQAIRDPLTGLFNRRFMQESLERELRRADRKKHPVSVIFIDLDHFKKFNDTYGHDAGDAVLKALANLFGTYFRGDDVVCRYGGEEFAIILPESSAKDAALRAEKLRADTKNLKLSHGGKHLSGITISIGVAAFPEHAFAAEDLLHVADQCLYRSKSGGRNRVTVAHLRQD